MIYHKVAGKKSSSFAAIEPLIVFLSPEKKIFPELGFAGFPGA